MENNNFVNETIENTISANDAYGYSYITVIIFGIIGNTLVIISILRQRILLQNNYYFLVFHLAICDLGFLLVAFVLIVIDIEEFLDEIRRCLVVATTYVFQIAGIGMMLIISVLRYRAAVHPLKPAISRRKLGVVCGLVYIIGVIVVYGLFSPSCILQQNDRVRVAYDKLMFACVVFLLYWPFPAMFMAVVYYKICRALVKQNKFLKRANAVRGTTSDSSFKFLRYIRNRRTFLVCFYTVICYGLGNVPLSVFGICRIAGKYDVVQMEYRRLLEFGFVLHVAGSCSVNPLIYGILDKKLLTFWKHCFKGRPREI